MIHRLLTGVMVAAFCVTGATVTGEVVEQGSGDPIEGATVVLASFMGGAADTVSTDESGVYTFEEVTRGYYSVQVSKDGYQPAQDLASVTSANATVTMDPIELVSTSATATGTIAGTVGDAENNEPIAGATVILLMSEGWGAELTPLDTVSTNKEGAFTFADIAIGSNYLVAASAEGYEEATEGPVRVREERTTNVELLLRAQTPPTSMIQGTVSDVGTEEAVGGAMLVLRWGTRSGFTYEWEPIDSTTSAGDGSYEFGELPASTDLQPYSVVAIKDGYRTFTSDPVLLGESDTQTVDMALEKVTTGDLHVFVGKETDESALEGASVSAALESADGVVYTGKTDAEGWVSFAGVVTGDYTLTASLDGYATETASRRISTDEIDTAYILLAAADEVPSRVVAGLVRDAEGNGIVDAEVLLTAEGPNTLFSGFDSTSATGDYEIGGVPTEYGQATITVTAEGYTSASKTINLNQDTVNLNFTLESSVAVKLGQSSASAFALSRIDMRAGELAVRFNRPSTEGRLAVYTADGQLAYSTDIRAGAGSVTVPAASLMANTAALIVVSTEGQILKRKVMLVR